MNEKDSDGKGLVNHEQNGWKYVSAKAEMLNTKQLD